MSEFAQYCPPPRPGESALAAHQRAMVERAVSFQLLREASEDRQRQEDERTRRATRASKDRWPGAQSMQEKVEAELAKRGSMLSRVKLWFRL